VHECAICALKVHTQTHTRSPAIVESFLDICEKEKGMIAVHCHAGLGRTGTLIVLWIMRKLGWTANEALAWVRICRPGSVIGSQQHFVRYCESCEWQGNSVRLDRCRPEGLHWVYTKTNSKASEILGHALSEAQNRRSARMMGSLDDQSVEAPAMHAR
jgi:hypothetical protein